MRGIAAWRCAKSGENSAKIVHKSDAKIAMDCVILCGGKSARMGETKALLSFGGVSLIFFQFLRLSVMFERVFIALKDSQKNAVLAALERDLANLSSLANPANPSLANLGAANLANLESLNLGGAGFKDSALIIEKSEVFAPMVGIVSSFEALKTQKIFFIPCDCPFVGEKSIKKMLAAAQDSPQDSQDSPQKDSAPLDSPRLQDSQDSPAKISQSFAAVCAKDFAKIHPLVGVWDALVAPKMREAIAKSEFKIIDFLGQFDVRFVGVEGEDFVNLNTKSDYQNALKRLNLGLGNG